MQTIFWSRWDPEGLAFAPLADAFRRKGALREALDLLTDGMSRHPDYATGHVIATRLYFDNDMHFEAELAARRVLELDSENLVALSTLTSILAGRGDVEEAARLKERLLAVDPDSDEARVVAGIDLEGAGEAPRTDLGEADAAEESVGDPPAHGRGPAEESVGDPPAHGRGPAEITELVPETMYRAGDPDSLLDDLTLEPSGGLDTERDDEEELERAMETLGLSELEPEPEAVTEAFPGPEAEFPDLDALGSDEPVEEAAEPMDFSGSGGFGGEMVDLEALTPEETTEDDFVDLAELAPEETTEDDFLDVAELAPDETTEDDFVDLAALAPDEPEEVVDLASLAPDESEEGVMDLAALAPDEEVEEAVDLAALAPDEEVEEAVDLAALAPDEEEEEAVDLAALAPDEPVEEAVDLAALAPDEEEEDAVDLAALAPDETDEAVDLAGLAPDELPAGGLDPEEGPSDPHPEEDMSSEPVYTRTLADLYVKQGFTDKALEVLRYLQRRDPDAADLAERIEALERGETVDTRLPEPLPSPGTGHSEEDVETRARDLAQSGEGGDDVDSPFAWAESAEEAAASDGDEAEVGDYFERLLEWENRAES